MNQTDAETETNEQPKYPKGVYFIIVTEFFEMFSFLGLQCMLILYLRNIFLFSDSISKIIFHTFVALSYACPVLGAIIADSWLGKFTTIAITGLVNALGIVLLSLSSIKLVLIQHTAVCLIGLTLVAVGSGCMKPCITPFGAGQFTLPEQTRQLHGYFTMFYVAVSAGSFIGAVTIPILKDQVRCFQERNCYFIAFGVLGLALVAALIVFVFGKPLYKIRKPQYNVVVEWMKCVKLGIKLKIKSREAADHWLDRCENKFGSVFVSEVKLTLKMLLLYIPNIVFWSLYDQQCSGWTLLANKMHHDFGVSKMHPEQMIALNIFFSLILVPIFYYCLYPLCGQCRLLTNLLPRMTCGGLLTALSFIIAAYISLLIECDEPVHPKNGECHLRIYNPLNCTMTITDALPYMRYKRIPSMEFKKVTLKVKGDNFVPCTVIGCEEIFQGNISINVFRVTEKESLGYFFSVKGLQYFKDNIEQHKENLPKIRILLGDRVDHQEVIEYWKNKLKLNLNSHSLQVIEPGTYTIGKFKVNFQSGGVYTLLASFKEKEITNIAVYEITKHNSLHILWLIPQYIALAAGTVMITVSGTEFTSTQAPKSMKAVMAAAWLLTSSLGNITVILVEVSNLFQKQSSKFFLFSGLMIAAMGVFGCLAKNYKYVQHL